jgi:hypothetical protein
VGLFRRRKETLNEKLLREAGLESEHAPGHPPVPVGPPKSVLATVGTPDGSGVGPKDWDTAVTVTAPALAGDRIEFTTLPDGDVIVSDESGDADLSPLADAVERRVDPPYRAVAERKDGDLWGVGAKRIRVARIVFPEGDKLDFSRNGSEDDFRVDGDETDAAAPLELERLSEVLGDSFYVEAERIDGDLWEVRATAL